MSAASWRKDDPEIWDLSPLAHTHTGKRCVPTEKAFSFFEEKEANILGKYKKRDEGEEEEEEKGRKKVARTNVKNVKESSRPRFLPPAFSP